MSLPRHGNGSLDLPAVRKPIICSSWRIRGTGAPCEVVGRAWRDDSGRGKCYGRRNLCVCELRRGAIHANISGLLAISFRQPEFKERKSRGNRILGTRLCSRLRVELIQAGAPCVLDCVRTSRALPVATHPVFCLALEGVTISCMLEAHEQVSHPSFLCVCVCARCHLLVPNLKRSLGISIRLFGSGLLTRSYVSS